MAHANEVFDAMRNSTMIVTTYTFNALLGRIREVRGLGRMH